MLKYQGAVYGLAYHLTQDASAAEDAAVTQDALLRDDQLRARAEVHRAILEQALHLNARVVSELQGRAAEHVALAEEALLEPAVRRWWRASLERQASGRSLESPAAVPLRAVVHPLDAVMHTK